ncbi:TetR/AcrR family transcriptional regulator [Timonella sp. A28]|uniref:TetR/AcrR family transcriptional regulator n=1 Tax=Timonella sp. A28 TaxID=3442640 RepID=UPI003EBA70CD
MGRTAKYTDDSILDTALALVSEDGAHGVTVVAIAARLGAPSGSIYHRFASRDLILARLWIRTVKQFQVGFLEALDLDNVTDAAQAAIAHTLGWSAEHRDEARVLTMYRREDLVALWPDELGAELSTLNDQVKQAVLAFTKRRFGMCTPEKAGLTRFALIDLPYAAARQTILDDRPPASWLREAVNAAALAALSSTTQRL